MHEAETHLSRLVEEAERGESFVIIKAGKPMVKVMRLDELAGKTPLSFGVSEGQDRRIKGPFKNEIEEVFYGRMTFLLDTHRLLSSGGYPERLSVWCVSSLMIRGMS